MKAGDADHFGAGRHHDRVDEIIERSNGLAITQGIPKKKI